uniref:Uncharacterized protein n=1 Tax=Cacopsylla melanoneura TaxID=428564 RepID=A0A8D8SJM7_9HEMI
MMVYNFSVSNEAINHSLSDKPFTKRETFSHSQHYLIELFYFIQIKAQSNACKLSTHGLGLIKTNLLTRGLFIFLVLFWVLCVFYFSCLWAAERARHTSISRSEAPLYTPSISIFSAGWWKLKWNFRARR